jgi:hypothetical protein
MDEHCIICDRVPFGDIVRLGFGHWRHDQCAPGSPAWRERYQQLPSSAKTEEGNILYVTFEKGA